jgi:hypothetical protein
MRRGAGAVLVGVAALACANTAAPQGTARVRLARAGAADTVRFEVRVVAQPCAEGNGILVTGARQGQGVLVWLRREGAAADTGTYPLLPRADSASVRGVIVAIRFVVGAMTHGLTVDDGIATVTRVTPTLALQVRGRGVDTGLEGQRSAELTLDRVPLAPGAASCRVQP